MGNVGKYISLMDAISVVNLVHKMVETQSLDFLKIFLG